MRLFTDRADAGRQLAQRLAVLRGRDRGHDIVVLGLPRGGVPVAFEVAKALRAPLDVLVVRKLGVPFQPELAFGAIGEGGVRVLNDSVIAEAHLSQADMAAVENAQWAELSRRSERFRGGHEQIPLAGRVAVIVDDGVATGATAKAACQVARAHGAAEVVLAVPIGATDTAERFADYADEVVCLETPPMFFAVGQGYRTFTQTSDDEVVALLERARAGFGEQAAGTVTGTAGSGLAEAADPPLRDEDVRVDAGGVVVAGHLMIPENPSGVVVFAHGSGSSRLSPRNTYVAERLSAHGLATLLFDLLTAKEEEIDQVTAQLRFDIPLLTERLVAVTEWVLQNPRFENLTIGYFGASTGAAAALAAAARVPEIGAVVSRGGRPDLAGKALGAVRAPTLLIVGGEDNEVLALNQTALGQLHCEAKIEIVPGATHLFVEPGALEQVASLAAGWFGHHLGARSKSRTDRST